ncbi:MAG: endonuclease/exonuclease/phosphatase [Leptothrix sp. (in: Bacteria)]|nr:endonuclease/exonuclease/phosphatase [Leptothrix sp. (in: b-proteobacteria)]
MTEHHIAFWNVENLFDVEDAPPSRRPDKIRRALHVGSASSEVKGWTQAVLDHKLAQLASVIGRMNGDRGPDILGLCEVENRHVLDLLVAALAPTGRAYAVVHADTQDSRGIDVAFLYDGAVFEVAPGEVFSHFVVKRTATRDLLQVNFRDRRGRLLACIGNHWPSRLGGQFESEPFRIIAAETLAYFHERIVEIHGSNVAVLAMGDFNDEPFDRSLSQHARAERSRAKVTRARSPALLNLMWPVVGQIKGTHFFDNRPGVLDQLLVSKGLLTGNSGFAVQIPRTTVVALPDMVAAGQYPQPRRHGRPSSPGDFDPDGFSDHFPVATVVTEA